MIGFQSLFLLFLVVPLLEIYLLIKVGGVIGALPTVLAVVGTALLGAFLIRLQGLSTMASMRRSMNRGQLPAMEMMEGVALVVAGGLLLTPGFFTDTIGFLLLVPPLRRWLIRGALRRAVVMQPGQGPHGPQGPSGPRTIDGEYWSDRDDDDPRLR
jgi:UPF0716 protein FxsA